MPRGVYKRSKPKSVELEQPSEAVDASEGQSLSVGSVVEKEASTGPTERVESPVPCVGAVEEFFLRLSDFCSKENRYPLICAVPTPKYKELENQVEKHSEWLRRKINGHPPMLAGIRVFESTMDRGDIVFG